MSGEKFKINSVIIDGGSGVLYQVNSVIDYSYLLSAKHIFYIDNKLENGLKNKVPISFYDDQRKKIDIVLIKNINYFEHDTLDAAILKIDKNENAIEVLSEEDCNDYSECILCGYPGSLRNNPNDNYSSYKISHKINQTVNGYFRLQTDFGTLTHEDVSGFSGGGIFRENNGYINIIGVQSSTVTGYANGQIDVVPIAKFKEIKIDGSFLDFIPNYLKSFEFLKEKAFDLNASIDDEDISFTRLFLKRKAEEVLSSNVTPLFIKDYFKDRLLINDKDVTKLNDALIYTTWLEFLTLINIVKEKTCNISDLEGVFSHLRLLYRKTDTDWLETNFLKDCLVSNYDGLAENGTVFIKTSKLPLKQQIKHYRLNKGDIVPRIDSLKGKYENGTLNSDVNNITNAISMLNEFVFDKFNFVHFEYLKHFMLVENSENYKIYKKSNEDELLIKLKEEYGKIFRI